MHKSFGQLNLWMLISFIILFFIDLYKDNHVRASINLFFKKLLLRNYWLDFYQISQECSLDRDLLTISEKSDLWGDTGTQTPLVSLFTDSQRSSNLNIVRIQLTSLTFSLFDVI